MQHDLSLAQKHAWNLARTLMTPIVLFKSDDEYGAYLNSQAVSLAFR